MEEYVNRATYVKDKLLGLSEAILNNLICQLVIKWFIKKL
jgi:hypothetical protein